VKTCTKCGATRALADFGKRKRGRDGLDARCRDCENARQKVWNAANPERTRAHQAKHRQKPERKEAQRKRAAAARLKWPEKERARYAVSNAVMWKGWARAADCPCGRCGAPAVSYHHLMGYGEEHRLDVVPLCGPCHQAEG